jgi:hypothetical protein
VLANDSDIVVADKGRPSGDHLVEHATDRGRGRSGCAPTPADTGGVSGPPSDLSAASRKA